MSTRSGKRIHSSPQGKNNNEIESLQNGIKTRSKRMKNNDFSDEQLTEKRRKKHYVRYPSDEIIENRKSNAKSDQTFRKSRRNTLKERNVEVTSAKETEVRHTLKTTRRTRRCEELDDDSITLEAADNAGEKKKKNKKKRKTQSGNENKVDTNNVVIVPSKKTNKKRNKKKSSSIIVEIVEHPKTLNASETSVDSFHSAAGSLEYEEYCEESNIREKNFRPKQTKHSMELHLSPSGNNSSTGKGHVNCSSTPSNEQPEIRSLREPKSSTSIPNNGKNEGTVVGDTTKKSKNVKKKERKLSNPLFDFGTTIVREEVNSKFYSELKLDGSLDWDNNKESKFIAEDKCNMTLDKEGGELIVPVEKKNRPKNTNCKDPKATNTCNKKNNNNTSMDINDQANSTFKIDDERNSLIMKCKSNSTFDKKDKNNSTYGEENNKKDKAKRIIDKKERANNTFDKKDKTNNTFEKKNKSNTTFDKDDKTNTTFNRDDKTNTTFDKDDKTNTTFDKDDKANTTFDKDDKTNTTFDKDDKANTTFDTDDKANTTFDKDDKTNTTFDKDDRANSTFDRKNKSLFDKKDYNSTLDNIDKTNTTFDKDYKVNTTFDKIDTTFDRQNKANTTFDTKDKANSMFHMAGKGNSMLDKSHTPESDRIVTKNNNIPDENSLSKKRNSITTNKRKSEGRISLENFSNDNTNESLLTSDTSKSSHISVTSDESQNENILNNTPLLVESSMEEENMSKSNSSPTSSNLDANIPPTSLKREGTFTKDSPEPKVATKTRKSIDKTPTRRKSLPSPGCTPFPLAKSLPKDKSILNVTRSIEKSRRSSLAEIPRATKVMFCSPSNNPTVVSAMKGKIIKSSLKGSNKSFIFDDSSCSSPPRVAGRKRSQTADRAAGPEPHAKRSRLVESHAPAATSPRSPRLRTRTLSASAKFPESILEARRESPAKERVRTRLPNFAALHARQFARMESLDECQRRRAERARLLLTPTGPVDRLSPKETQAPKPSEPKPLKKTETPTKNKPQTGAAGYSRFGFKLQADGGKPFSFTASKAAGAGSRRAGAGAGLKRQATMPSLAGTTRKQLARQAVMREKSFTGKRDDDRLETRTVIKGVRTNRRFELQMRMRNINT